jgi:uncharacterized protein
LKPETFPLKLLLWALVLFIPLFITRGVGALDFWWWMTANILLLLAVVQGGDAEWRRLLVIDLRDRPCRKVVLGLLAAAVLYLVFWLGNRAIRYLLAGAGADISAVYAFKEQASVLRITVLMLLVIGPGEELFWRGFLQRRFGGALGGGAGWLLTAAVYAGVHIASGNPILVLAAGVCGLFWGWLYWRHRSMLLNAVSHTAWDVAVFLLFPFG